MRGNIVSSKCSAIGATNCYFVSRFFGEKYILKYIPDKINEFNMFVKNHDTELISLIVFLRCTPFIPNWIINIYSPHLKIPPEKFFIGTLLGVLPLSFIHVQAGYMLDSVTGKDISLLTPSNFAVVGAVGILSLLPLLRKANFASP